MQTDHDDTMHIPAGRFSIQSMGNRVLYALIVAFVLAGGFTNGVSYLFLVIALLVFALLTVLAVWRARRWAREH